MTTHPFAIIVDGVSSGANILEDYSSAAPELPWVDPGTVSLSTDANGAGGSLSFVVVQVKTPGAGPWWRSGAVNDNARVRFQVSGTTTFLGFITTIDAELAENGIGTRATVTAAAASSYLDKIILYKGRLADPAGNWTKEQTANFNIGTGSESDISGSTDQAVLNSLVSFADKVQNLTTGAGRVGNRLIVNTAATPTYSGATVVIGKQRFVPGTLRSCLDTVKEAAESKDGEQRRYWVAPNGTINYARLGSNVPTYANAPFKIVTTGTYSPYGSASAAATLQARGLGVSLDHDSIVKKVRFVMNDAWSKLDSQISGGVYTVDDPYGRIYNAAAPDGAGMTTRGTDAPRPESIVQVNPVPGRAAGPTYWTTKLTGYSQKFFGSNTYPNRAAPLRTIRFSVRGADTTNNPYGYANGFRQTGLTTHVLQSGWEAGQYVSIVASGLDLNGLYRIESITMSFEPGSMIRRFDMACERVPKNPLKKFLEKA